MGYIPPPPDPFGRPAQPLSVGKRRMPVWAIVTIMVILLIFGGCCTMVIVTARMIGFNPVNILSGGSPFVPTAEVIVGTPLAWRDITPAVAAPYRGAGWMMYTDVAHGDVDGDGSDELITEDSAGNHLLLELDGTDTSLQLYFAGRLLAQTWDYDADGRADLLVDDYGGSYCSIWDLQGKQLGQVPGYVSWQGVVAADFDGDGRDDLVLEDPNNAGSAYTVFAPGGVVLWNCVLPQNMFSASFGDTNGDGLLEAICSDQGYNAKLRVLDQAGGTTDYPGWSDYARPQSCLDVDGDGIDEVFASNNGFQNISTGSFTKLDYPRGRSQAGGGFDEPVLRADIDDDGTPELITRGQRNFGRNSGLYFFDTDGACTYYEELGASIEQLFIVGDDQGFEYLVLRTDEQLLITP